MGQGGREELMVRPGSDLAVALAGMRRGERRRLLAMVRSRNPKRRAGLRRQLRPALERVLRA
jgi:hypothetical protein